MRQVPLARRTLFADRRRLVASLAGVGLAVMLILLLDGLWAGVRSQASRYEDRVGADLYVVAPGVRTLFTDASVVPVRTAEVVRRTPGVRWATPVRTTYSILDLHGRKVAASVVGSVPGAPGGPWELASGRLPRTGDEVVVDSVLARRHELRTGSTLQLSGLPLRVVGTAADSAGFMTGFVFVPHATTDRLLRAAGTTSAVLVGTDHPADVRRRLQGQGLSVLDPGELRTEDVRLATKIYGTPLRLMVGVAFAAGTLVIALTAYATVVEHRREYGIVKAIGADARRLVALALGQTLGLAVLGLGVGLLLFVAGRAVIVWARPQFDVLLTGPSVARAASAALAMALLAALVPARRLVALEPATAYRGA